MVQAFRRADSLYESIQVKLRGLDPDAVYTLTNLDVADKKQTYRQRTHERTTVDSHQGPTGLGGHSCTRKTVDTQGDTCHEDEISALSIAAHRMSVVGTIRHGPFRRRRAELAQAKSWAGGSIRRLRGRRRRRDVLLLHLRRQAFNELLSPGNRSGRAESSTTSEPSTR